MTEFSKVANERKRMCDSYEICTKGCPLGKRLNDKICSSWMFENPVLAEAAIMRWAAEHPIKTNRDKFKEVFGMDLVITGNTNKWLDQEYKGGQK